MTLNIICSVAHYPILLILISCRIYKLLATVASISLSRRNYWRIFKSDGVSYISRVVENLEQELIPELKNLKHFCHITMIELRDTKTYWRIRPHVLSAGRTPYIVLYQWLLCSFYTFQVTNPLQFSTATFLDTIARLSLAYSVQKGPCGSSINCYSIMSIQLPLNTTLLLLLLSSVRHQIPPKYTL